MEIPCLNYEEVKSWIQGTLINEKLFVWQTWLNYSPALSGYALLATLIHWWIHMFSLTFRELFKWPPWFFHFTSRFFPPSNAAVPSHFCQLLSCLQLCFENDRSGGQEKEAAPKWSCLRSKSGLWSAIYWCPIYRVVNISVRKGVDAVIRFIQECHF